MIAWIRVLGVVLTSTSHKLRVSYGFNEKDNLNINISGNKYLSSLKDEFTVRIDNLPYVDVVKLINNKFNEIEIICGYKSSSSRSIFSGAILHISNEINDYTTHSMIFVCCSKVLGLFNNRLNLSLTSGINMYSALNIICKQAGINNSKISTSLKGKIITDTLSVSGTASSIIDTICRQSSDIAVQTDASNTAMISVWNANTTKQRVIPINPRTLIVANGYPTLSSSGLTLYVMPTFNFMPGDVIQLDNAYINISQSSKDEVLNDPQIGSWLDEKGEYMIYQITYNLSNRSSAFSLRMLCKKRHLLDSLSGGRK